jgi:hypothetical protein
MLRCDPAKRATPIVRDYYDTPSWRDFTLQKFEKWGLRIEGSAGLEFGGVWDF